MKHLIDANIGCVDCKNFVDVSNDCLKNHEVGQGRECPDFKVLKHKPIVKFGRVAGYDNPMVVQCRTVEADKEHRNKRSCKGQMCDYWELCCMPNRVIILEEASS